MQKPTLVLILWLSLLWPVALAQTGPSDAKELESFLDGAMSVAMETNHVAGGVVAIV